MLTITSIFWIFHQIWSLIFLLIPLVAIIDIVTSKFSREKTIIWIVIVVLFPLLGTIIYFWLGGRGKG